MHNSDKGQTFVYSTADLEYSTEQINKMYYLSAQNTEF